MEEVLVAGYWIKKKGIAQMSVPSNLTARMATWQRVLSDCCMVVG
jgi:hypothetical protein